MSDNFKISAVNNTFNHLFDLSEKELLTKGAIKMIVDEKPGYPCRVSLEDAEIGEEVVLFPYRHHTTDSPYQASGPIFARKNAKKADLVINEIPKMLLHRLLSLRIYDDRGMMIAAKTLMGEQLKDGITALFNDKLAKYIQIHNAGPGCYNCQVDRSD